MNEDPSFFNHTHLLPTSLLILAGECEGEFEVDFRGGTSGGFSCPSPNDEPSPEFTVALSSLEPSELGAGTSFFSDNKERNVSVYTVQT